MSLEKWLLLPDVHVPFHSTAAFNLVLRAAESAKIKNIVCLGDFADFYAVSSHPKPPDRRADLQWEVDEVNKALRRLESTFTGKKKFCAGNHCDRLSRYLSDRAPELFGTLKIEELFGLKQNGWEYTPYKSFTKVGKLHLTHDCGKAGPNAHRDAMNAFQGNVVLGHTHRLGYAVEGNVKGEPHVGAMLGWLGDPEQCDYMFKVRAARDWAHGFGLAYKEPNGNVHVVPIPIVGGKCLVEGKLVK